MHIIGCIMREDVKFIRKMNQFKNMVGAMPDTVHEHETQRLSAQDKEILRGVLVWRHLHDE